ncbi:hypothetical protein SAMD00019534_050760 [Acytostelium subglobosum LB1]|uniref:hypothetical protein n=1 Tax=Acytostelium subglobosum LB1 TaxID=1410327 RepID=UPI0006449AD2|nr:hypothetical protein SAMD00019534_050760 [Acytostelium subglobosum LB1]GAM21901.1 hypothetical protein SAMD00019534_050760 [Acytostelium subglobosum LB1]|eukprot:XP_012755001.1 hypothetical protein SAMD00019534_050760 [Acytostelium subglobosum LB1]
MDNHSFELNNNNLEIRTPTGSSFSSDTTCSSNTSLTALLKPSTPSPLSHSPLSQSQTQSTPSTTTTTTTTTTTSTSNDIAKQFDLSSPTYASISDLDSFQYNNNNKKDEEKDAGGTKRKVSDPDRPNHSYSFINQFNALFLKSISYQRRQYKTNIMQALVPVLMISIMSLLQIATPPIKFRDNSNPISLPLPFIFPPLIDYSVPFITNDANVMPLGTCCQNNTGFLSLFTTANQQTQIPNYQTLGNIPTDSFTFEEYNDVESLDAITYKEGRQSPKILLGYNFQELQITPGSSVRSNIISYANDTTCSSSIINIMNNAIFQTLTGTNNKLVTGIKQFPYYAKNEKKDMIQPQENFWYLFMLSFCMVIFVANVVYEKEHRLRESMKMAGLRMRTYWLVQYIFNFTLYMVIVFVAIAFAYILKFRFFTQTEFSLYFALFVLFGLTQIAFAFFISTFFSSVYTCTVVSFIYIIFTALSSNLLNNAFIMNPNTSLATFIITALIPHVAFHRAVSYISLAYIGNAPGLTWYDVFQHHQIPSLFGLLLGEFFLYGLLHQYLEMVLPSSYGVSQHPLFFFQKSFWASKMSGNLVHNKSSPTESTPLKSLHQMYSVDMVPSDVTDEYRYTYARENTASIRLMSLFKSFKVGKKTNVAVDNLTLSVEKGQCFAIIAGHDIVTNLQRAQQSLGVCPQDDVLWAEMTGREHLLFYGRMKNLKGEALHLMVDKSLAEVMLTEAQDKAVREYSGGMKRRLSLAISLIGAPTAILLDEPTTGVDPFSRRIVWDVINSYKSKCAIILTTHNMEEAEILCDRVCIIDHGLMKCIGRSGDLKTRYGAGHTLSVSTTNNDSMIHEYITSMIPNVKLIHEISCNRTYAVPRRAVKMSQLFKSIQENKNKYSISDWGICQAGLEEVLLQAAHGHSNNNNNNNVIASAARGFEHS